MFPNRSGGGGRVSPGPWILILDIRGSSLRLDFLSRPGRPRALLTWGGSVGFDRTWVSRSATSGQFWM